MTTQARELAGIISNAGDLNFSDDITLGSDGAVLNFGADSEVTITHVHNTGLILNSTKQLQFGDSGTYINQSADGVLNLTSDTEVEINATTVDINANVDVSGNIVLAGTITVGDADDDNMVINANVNSHIIPNTDDTFDLGSSGQQWRNVYVDGTLEADAITIGGVTLSETIADTVGAMTTSNTESGITVAYDDADNTLDFTVATLNQDTTGTAALFTASANNSTDETVYPVFVDGATGSQGAETDTGLTYNPSTGMLTSTGVTATFTGNITGNVTGNTSGTAATVTTAAQPAITSLGTLTALTVDNLGINGNTITANSGAVNITPAGGSAIVLDGTINVDAGVVTGATSITSTAFVGNITGNVTGNASGTAATVTTAAQTNITSVGTLTALTGGTGDLIWDSPTFVVDSSANKVGIGTASPDYPLEVEASNPSVGYPQFVVKGKDNDFTGIGLMSYGSNGSQRNWVIGANLAVAGALNIGYTANATNVPSSGNVTSAILIDSSGKVGIGTGSPAAPLDVVSNSSAVGIDLRGRSADNISQLTFESNDSGTSYSQIQSLSSELKIKTLTDIPMSFYQNASEVMRIHSDGKVGIGTTSPANKLEIKSTTAWESTLMVDQASDGSEGAQIFMKHTSASPADNDYLGFLHFKGMNSAAQEVQYARIHATSADVTDGTEDGSLFLMTAQAGTANSNGIAIVGGNVGIGTASPHTGAKLHIVDGAGTVPTMAAGDILTIQNNDGTSDNAGFTAIAGTAGISYINFGDSGDKNIGGLNYYHSDNSLRFIANAAEHMRIFPDGQLGVSAINFGAAGTPRVDSSSINQTNSGADLKYNADGGHTFKTYDGGWVDKMAIEDVGVTHKLSNAGAGQVHVLYSGGYVTMADDATITLSGVANTGCLISIGSYRKNGQNVAYAHGLIFLGYNIGTTGGVIIADPTGFLRNSDTDGFICVYKAQGSGSVTVKNRLGISNNVCITVHRYLGL